ncbi:hypothetical protein PoB_004368600 [Plakobranchus ocellatus]|uniref:Uncharacterized protein n=1 Tax=Plakobranchus ocellatus TaxID=259542 RepID=A0AAV4B9R9_9GAST|nr:hypothetical protein PoB_004368600 [Plakobranchus ocellatus]
MQPRLVTRASINFHLLLASSRAGQQRPGRAWRRVKTSRVKDARPLTPSRFFKMEHEMMIAVETMRTGSLVTKDTGNMKRGVKALL